MAAASRAAKIVEADAVTAQPVEQGAEPARRKQLPRQQVMALHAGLVAGIDRAVDRTKWQAATNEARFTHARGPP
jgi:hypothetical protein